MTSSAHIGRISLGGPGSATMTRPSGRETNQPGAVPFGLASASDDGIRHACLRFSSGNAIPRRRHSSRSHASRSRVDGDCLAAGRRDGLAGQVVRRRVQAAGARRRGRPERVPP